MFSFHILCFKTEKEKILLLLLFFFKIEKKPFRSENFHPIRSLGSLIHRYIHRHNYRRSAHKYGAASNHLKYNVTAELNISP